MRDEPPSAEWRPPPDDGPRALDPGHAHVHRVALDRPADVLVRLAEVLSPDERARAARQRRPRDGARWIVARAALRHVLAAYVGCEPPDVVFAVDDLGKPHVASIGRSSGEDRAPTVAADLAFNLSHSDGLALVAVARGGRVGVDVEAVGGRNDLAAIAARYFSPREQAYLAATSADARAEAFLLLWTAKEAYTKAIGAGLSAGFANFDVEIGVGGALSLSFAARPADVPADHGTAASSPAASWTLRRLDPAPGYRAAVALDLPDPTITCWDWMRLPGP